MTYPYYRVTKWLRDGSGLDSWFDWFVGLGVPVCIVRNDDSRYSVWVVGEESCGDPDRLNYGVGGLVGKNEERLKGKVMRLSGNWWTTWRM